MMASSDIQLNMLVSRPQNTTSVESIRKNVTAHGLQAEILRLAEAGEWENVFWLIQSESENLDAFTGRENNPPEWNILQYACDIVEEDKAARIVKRIFKLASVSRTGDDDDRYREQMGAFVDNVDTNGQTALHLAIARDHEKVVEILVQNSADVTISANDEDTYCLDVIYKTYPNIMLRLFDEGLSIDKDKHDTENEMLWQLKCDFTSVIGIPTNRAEEGEKYNESRLLGIIIGQPHANLSKILLHPLVQLFIEAKGQKLKLPIWISILFHVFWSIVGVLFLVDSAQSLQQITNETSRDNSCQDQQEIFPGLSGSLMNISVGIFWFICLSKELIELLSCPTRYFYWRHYINTCEWILLIVIALAVPIVHFVNHLPNSTWLATAASLILHIGTFSALVLIQGQSTKIPSVGVYNEMLVQTFLKFCYFVLAFSPMLLTFMITFSLLLRQRPEFGVEWGLGVTKIFSMMTGELNYNDIFHADCIANPIATKLVFLLFIALVVILLQNLLVALTVDEVEKFKESCMARHFRSRVEIICQFDSFLCSPLVMRILRHCKREHVVHQLLVGSLPDRPEGERHRFDDKVESHVINWCKVQPAYRSYLKTAIQVRKLGNSQKIKSEM